MNSTDPLFSSAALRKACTHLPEPRLRPIFEGIQIPNQRHAAILVPVLETPAGLALIVTRRHADMRIHSDHWVFPGGRVDPEDPSPASTAIREASEELGVPEFEFELLGQLDSHGPIITGYIVDVFVALISNQAQLNPNSREVAEVETFLLADMCQPEKAFRRNIVPDDDASATVIDAPSQWNTPILHFTFRPGKTMWGLQAQILADLLLHLRGEQVAHLKPD